MYGSEWILATGRASLWLNRVLFPVLACHAEYQLEIEPI
jgi:hypothetical protein